MAKHLVQKYTFTPSLDKVTIDGNVSHKRLLLITNVTTGVVLYNFADEQAGASVSYDYTTELTTIIFEKDCNGMSATDTLQIFYEQDYVLMEPSETFVDPVSKFRVSTPQNLIDTDFEYGPQASKWETLQLINAIPSFFSSTADTTIPFVTKIESTTGSEIITVTTSFDHGLNSGTPITVTGLKSVTAEGTYLIQSVPTSKVFSYKARAKQLETKRLEGTYSSIIPGQFFQGSQISVDEAEGIISDTYTKVVTIRNVTDLVLNAAPHYTWKIGETVTNGAGATGVLTRISGTTIGVSDVNGAFGATNTISISGSSFTSTISSVAAADAKFFIDNLQQPALTVSRKAIYIFDISSPTLSGHTFSLSETSDGSNNGGTEYTTFVYKNGTIATPGAYLRVYITGSTPNLHYYCGAGVGHENEGSSLTPVTSSESKILLKTVNEHGFADNTNFYFVNSVSPKALDVSVATATAPDGAPFVDTRSSLSISVTADRTDSIPYNNESTYTLRFSENDINYGNNTINIPAHGMQNGYAVLYYPAPGDIPIGSLNRMCVYYVERVDANNIKLHDSQRINILKDLQTGGTFNFGKHNLGLCYNVYREYKAWGDYYLYYYTYYWNWGSTYSGHDFAAVNGTFGLGQQAWDAVATFSISRPGYGGHNFFVNNTQWYGRFGTNWKTYGYHLQTLPLGTTAIYQGSYDFITDNDNYGVNGNNNGDYSNGYTLGGYGQVNGRSYWTSAFWGDFMNSSYLRVYGNEGYYWAYQGDSNGWWASINGYTPTNDRYFNSIGDDGSTNMFFMLLKRNTSTNDSFYKTEHLFNTNDLATITVTSGNPIRYWNDLGGSTATLTTGSQVYIDKIDSNRFRIKPSANSSPYRLSAANGTYVFAATVNNIFRNSIYIANNQFSNDELILYSFTAPATVISGLTNNSTYFYKAVNANRFTLGTTVGYTTPITLTSTGTGTHTFENASASFGAVDGSYTTTRAVDENTLEITLPFKLSPGSKPFVSSTAVTTGANGYITIPNHFFSNGTRIIYDANGNTDIGGLTNNVDYFVIVLDDSRIRLASSLANAKAGTAITLTSASTGTHKIITSNLSGLITGAGTVSVTSTTRTINGSSTNFKRYFKVGDTIRIINSATTPGTIVFKTITAIKDDSSLLVNTAFEFTGSSLKYFIPTYIYVRPDGYFLHRPFDGGMEIGTSKSPDGLICRQTRKYFRYQSGKGIQTSFAINFIPQNPITSLAYTPIGTTTVLTGSANSGEDRIIVSDTAGLVKDMEIAGPGGIQVGCLISEILNSTTIVTTKLISTSFTSQPITFSPAKYGTIISQRPHNVNIGTRIEVINSNINIFNASFDVAAIVDDFTFRVFIKDVPQNVSNSGGFPSFSVKNWNNSYVRAGMFDFQNGFFFEYDGQTLNCVRRSSVQQLTGVLSVTKGSGIVTGTNTQFASQLNTSDKIVIRGMTHKVVKVTNNNQITIQPAYKGVTNDNVIGTKTIDVRVPQSLWNIDHCDGSGPSGYVLHIGRIQMCYADYSWYGAGKIRFGFKDQNGHVKYVHEFKHNNKLLEAYFRSGNLPARYEIENIGTPSFVPSLFHWGTSVIMDGMFQDDEAYLFTAGGNTLKFTNATSVTATTNGNSTIIEERISSFNSIYFLRIPFPSSSASTLTINTLLFNASVSNSYFLTGRNINSRSFLSGSTYFVYIQYQENSATVFPRNYSATINSRLGNPAVASSTTFNVGAPSGSDNLIPSYMPLISIRLAPSVDSSISGALGQREIINRMQLKLDSVGIQVTHETEVSLVLNAELSTDLYQNVPEPSLSQLVKHTPNETLSGGQKILSFRAAGGSVEGSRRLAYNTTFSLAELSALGNSILGGDGVYPNGPDLLTVVAEVTDTTGVSNTNPYSATARVTWKESQA